jgi:hypothetical protein
MGDPSPGYLGQQSHIFRVTGAVKVPRQEKLLSQGILKPGITGMKGKKCSGENIFFT